VTDTGIGIDSAELERMFEPFSQGDSSTTRRYGGTGLGLTISYELVELMGGEIGADSEPGGGSSFWFSVPLTVLPGGQADPERLDGLRLLVVDDNPVAREILVEQLRRRGASAAAAASGREALELVRSAGDGGEPFECALVDVGMPELDGIELLRRLDSDARLPKLPSVMLTRSSAERLAVLDAGAAIHLRKPVRGSRLAEAIHAAQGRPTAERPELPAGPRTAPAGLGSGERPLVLVAEDNAVNSALTVRLLETYGYEADVARDGREAVEAIDRRHYDAVLMDCQMPSMDGYEATAEIRRREPPARRVPIVAMTAHSMKGDRERCIEAGMDDYLSKPIRPADLAHTLARWVESEDGAPGSDLDPTPLRDLRSALGDEATGALEQVVGVYLEQGPSRLARIREAIEQDDAVGLREAAHALAGSSATLGAMEVAALSRRLEELAGASDLADANGLFEALDEAFELARRALNRELAGAT
jgi:CheY-like chemotaxis protein/HPt (histidine-containing phosphotransfer) domain-containing protein